MTSGTGSSLLAASWFGGNRPFDQPCFQRASGVPLANVSLIPQSSRAMISWRPRDSIDLHPNATLDEVIHEIDDDPTGIFWG